MSFTMVAGGSRVALANTFKLGVADPLGGKSIASVERTRGGVFAIELSPVFGDGIQETSPVRFLYSSERGQWYVSRRFVSEVSLSSCIELGVSPGQPGIAICSGSAKPVGMADVAKEQLVIMNARREICTFGFDQSKQIEDPEEQLSPGVVDPSVELNVVDSSKAEGEPCGVGDELTFEVGVPVRLRKRPSGELDLAAPGLCAVRRRGSLDLFAYAKNSRPWLAARFTDAAVGLFGPGRGKFGNLISIGHAVRMSDGCGRFEDFHSYVA